MVRYSRDQFLIGLVEKCASSTGGDDIFEGETLMMRRIYRKCSSLVGSLWLPQGTNQDLSGEGASSTYLKLRGPRVVTLMMRKIKLGWEG